MSEQDLYSGIDTSQFRGYPVSLDGFEGPLDLLLYLVQKDRVEIWDISISRITRQYLDYLQTLQALNVEIAGEFLVMAATLMRIKSQMLLPRPELGEDGNDLFPLTREGLIQKLLELRRFKEAAIALREIEERRRCCLPRGGAARLPDDHLYPLREVRITDLAAYLREVLQRTDDPPPLHEVVLDEIRLEERIELLQERISAEGGAIRFVDLLGRRWWRLEWIVTFLAMLELVRQGKITVLQEEPFGELWLLAAGPNGEAREDQPVASGTDRATEATAS